MGCPKLNSQIPTNQKQFALCLLKSPNSIKTLNDVKTFHAILLRTGLYPSSYATGNFIARCAALGLMSYAAQVFDQIPQPDSFVWNTIIRGFQQNHQPRNALSFFDGMRVKNNIHPDQFTFPFVVKACGELMEVWKGLCVHGQVVKYGLELDVYTGTSLVEFYLGLEDVTLAREVFNRIPHKDEVLWTVMLSGYVIKSSDLESAAAFFDQMPDKDMVAWNMMISSHLKFGDIEKAGSLFDQAPVKDILMYNTMLGAYTKHGGMGCFLQFFHQMPERDVVSWNSVIFGLVNKGKINDAMIYFNRMQMENIGPNEVTLMTVLSACGQVGALDTGKWLHSYLNRSHLSLDAVIGTALVDMYAKCGDLGSARFVFDSIGTRDVVAWNAMIMGYSMNGQSRNAVEIFLRMKNEAVKPNDVTIIGVLCACTHGGLVEEGRKFFDSMSQEYGLSPKIEHYGCMVDLLGRAGMLNEAYDFIQTMPLSPHRGVWGALLGACKIHCNIELAEYATEKLIHLDHEDGGYLAIMSNIYANAGRWNDVRRMRELMTEKGFNKLRGCSSIEVDGEIHEFGVEEKIHLRANEIYNMIDEITGRLRISGHVSKTHEVFFDVEEEEKEKALVFHSEKMAVAFGLIATDEGTVLRIVKNLRICTDCHAAIKLISQVFRREIVIRDRNRFHHFKEGYCSCGDYW